MFKDNPLLAQLKQQIRETLPTIKGTVKTTDKNYGFLETEKSQSYFISPPDMKKVLHGDRISAVLRTDGDKKSAEPESLIESPWQRFIARVKWNRDRLQVIPDHIVFQMPINANGNSALAKTLKEGDWVVAELKRHPLKGDKGFFAEVTQLAATAEDRYAPWKVALARHQLEVAAPAMPDELTQESDDNRIDLTDKLFVTIDGESTKDMDDALWLEADEQGWVLTVAIADPASYVLAGSALDEEAGKRAFTVYLPGDKITMLPEPLSDQYCSLMPNERRAALCCEMRFDSQGERQGEARFYTAWICSKHKLAYDAVSDWLGDADGAQWQPENDALAAMLNGLYQFADARQQWRKQHALVFADTPDFRFELDDQGNVTGIRAEYRRAAHQIVEESMIAANTAAAEWLAARHIPAVFNVHLGLDSEQVDKVVEILNQQGGNFDAETLLTLDGFRALRNWLDEQPTGYAAARIRKFQTFSTISTDVAPHYGLGVEAYATWTSPIRKYGDLINQRVIKAVLANQPVEQVIAGDKADYMIEQRRKHRLAERNVNDALYARYFSALDDLASRPFEGEIIDINRGGIRLKLNDNGAVVFIPAGLIHKNRKQVECDIEQGILSIGGKPVLKLADTLTVIIHEVKERGTLIAKPATTLGA